MKMKKSIILLFLSSSTWAYNQQEIVQVIHQQIKHPHFLNYQSTNKPKLHWKALPFPAVDGKYNIVVMKNKHFIMFMYGPYSTNTTMFKSNDAGKNWNAISSPKVKSIHHLISIDENRLLLAGDNKIFLSKDQGENWVLTATIDQSCDKLFSPVPNLILLTTDSNGPIPGLYRSTDGGQTFTPARLGINGNYPIFTIGGKENALVVATNDIYLSANQGVLWKLPSLNWTDKLLYSVATNSQSDIFLAAYSKLYKSDITGQIWETIKHYMGGIKIIKTDVNDRLYAVGQQNDDGLYRSLDNGQTWELLHHFNQIIEFETLPNGKILANTDEGLMLSDESQLNYTQLTDLPYSNATIGDVIALDNEHFFATALPYSGPLYGSNDAGKTWSVKRKTDVIDVATFNMDLAILEYNGNGQSIMVSDDFGDTWQSAFQIPNNYCYSLSSQHGGLIINCVKDSYFTSDLKLWDALKIDKKSSLTSYYSGRTIYVTDGNSIQSSNDNGSNWKYLLNDLNQEHAYISGYDDEVLIIAFNYAGIIKMTNEGKDWDLINNGLTNFNFTDLIVVDANHYLISTDDGIFYTQDGGQHWLQENSGLNNLAILNLSIYQNTLLAGTDGSGAFKTELTRI